VLHLSAKRVLLLVFGAIFSVFLLLMYLHRNEKPHDEAKTVYIKEDGKGFKVYRNGAYFKIKGATGREYLKDLAEIGGNTIRIYDFNNIESILNEAHQNNLAVIVDIPLSKYTDGDNFYSDEVQISRYRDTIKKLVNTYKHHPALLFWNLGNELDYPLVFRKNDFINTFNNFIEVIQTEDPNHPVGTSIIPSRTQTLSIHLHSPQLDFIGFNAFGNLNTVKPLIEKLDYITNVLPYYISEYANNGPWEEETTLWSVPIEQTSTKKAEQYMAYYKSSILKDSASMGDLVFFWGQKQEHTHTWFSIFDDEGRKSQIFYNLKSMWGKQTDPNDWPPQIKYMLIDHQGAKDTLVYQSQDVKTAQIIFDSEIDSTFQFKWEIYKEGWNYEPQKKEKRPDRIPMEVLLQKENSITFCIPEKEGPYRLFGYAYDQKGNFATTNTPFYVLNK